MNSSKAEAENIEPSAGKEMLDKYWAEVKTEIDDINIVSFDLYFTAHWSSIQSSIYVRSLLHFENFSFDLSRRWSWIRISPNSIELNFRKTKLNKNLNQNIQRAFA